MLSIVLFVLTMSSLYLCSSGIHLFLQSKILKPLKISLVAVSFAVVFQPTDIEGVSLAAASAAPITTQKLIYKSGKTPFVEGSDKSQQQGNDMSGPGGRKEISFLRCISNCKTKCQQPGEGLAKNDCVQDCQDQCCTSYEQCSFRIKSTAGNAI